MRKAFTLIEILVVVAIIAITISVSMLGMGAGTAAARLRGTSRDAFATIRQARSLALVTGRPCVLTYVDSSGEGSSARIDITAAKLVSSQATEVQTLSGETRRIGGDAVGDADGAADGESSGGGEKIEDILFSPVDSEVLKDVRIKVEKEGDAGYGDVPEAKAKSKISAFSNVDYLLGKFAESRKEEGGAADSDGAGKEDGADAAAPSQDAAGKGETVSVVWEANGRCEPHKVWIYPAGSGRERGVRIEVDRFGAAKIVGAGED